MVVTKISDKSNKNEVYFNSHWRVQFPWGGEGVEKQEHEAAGQVAATVGKQTEANAGAQPASPFYSVGDPSTWE